jgi:high affinity sulfate transporter 1
MTRGVPWTLSTARHDLVAGVVLTAFLVPVGMAYAQASGLPPVNGLYATIVPLLVYAALGPSPILVLGPDSTLAPLIAATILPLAAGDPDRAVALAGALAIGGGVICVAAGLARFGFLTELVSMPVRVGYLNGIVVVVFVSQTAKVLGIPTDADGTLGVAADIVQGIADDLVDPISALVGALCFVGLLVMRRIDRRIPGVLVVVVASMVAVAVLDLEDDIPTVGELPSGLPSLGLPGITWDDVAALVAGSFTIAVVSFTDTSLFSRAFAARGGRSVDPNRELIALGAANVATGFAQGFSVSASSSRTPVAAAAGAKTQLTGVVGALMVAALLLFAPGLLSTLPMTTLAAVVLAAVLSLADVGAMVRLLRTRPGELVLSVAAFVGVVVLGVLWGIGLAVVMSLVVFVQRAWRPDAAVLVRIVGRKGYHDAERHPEGRQIPGLLLYRFGAPLFFANSDHFHDELLEEVDAAPTPVQWVVVAADAITDVDATADDMLHQLTVELRSRGIVLAFAGLRGTVRERMARAGTVTLVGSGRFYSTVGEAVHEYARATGVEPPD